MRSLSISVDLQLAQLGSAHAGRVERHEHGAVKQIAGRVDQSDRFLSGSESSAAVADALGIRHILEQVVPLQCLAEEEAQRGHVLPDGARHSSFLSWNRCT